MLRRKELTERSSASDRIGEKDIVNPDGRQPSYNERRNATRSIFSCVVSPISKRVS
jgi:hypothetical protein